MNLAPSLLQSILDPTGQQLATLKDATTGKHVPLVAPSGKPLLVAELALTNTTYADVVAAPAAGSHIRLWALAYSNVDSGTKVPRMRWGGGAAFFQVPVTVSTNYLQCPIPSSCFLEGADATALQASLASGTATGTNVQVHALYTIETE